MKKYNTYKFSGVEWIGEVPTGWEVKKIKYCTLCYDGKRIPIEGASRVEGIYPYWGAGNIVDYVDDYIFDEELVLLGEDGAQFFNRLKPVAFLVNEKIWVNNHIHVLKAKCNMSASFLRHALNCIDYAEYITGSVLTKLTQSTMNSLVIPIPPFSEQTAIAEYLDAKCAKIDNVVAIQKKRIELLKELKQSIITKAVTKGLDKNAKMKPSGVEWIGEVPNGWKVGKIKFYANIIMGQSPDGKDITDEGKTPFMQGNAEFTEKYPNPIYYCETCNKHSRIGDVLMSVRAPVGELNLSDKIYGIGRGLCSIKAEQELSTPFLWYYLMKSRDDFNSFANGSTFTAITVDDLKNFPLILPPLSEQTAIAAYLDKKCATIDKQIAKVEKQIELLYEYKQSVITECVTGKRKVC